MNFTVTKKSGETFAVVPVAGCIRIGNYTVGPNNGGWVLHDWSKDVDVRHYDSRLDALATAKRLVARSTKQDPAAVRA